MINNKRYLDTEFTVEDLESSLSQKAPKLPPGIDHLVIMESKRIAELTAGTPETMATSTATFVGIGLGIRIGLGLADFLLAKAGNETYYSEVANA